MERGHHVSVCVVGVLYCAEFQYASPPPAYTSIIQQHTPTAATDNRSSTTAHDDVTRDVTDDVTAAADADGDASNPPSYRSSAGRDVHSVTLSPPPVYDQTT